MIPNEPRLFKLDKGENNILVGFHVDDVISASKSKQLLDWFRMKLTAEFKAKRF